MLFALALAAAISGVVSVGPVSAASSQSEDPDQERRAPGLQPKATGDRSIKPATHATARANGRKLSWNKIRSAIYAEGNFWAAHYEYIRGRDNWFEIGEADGSCYWIIFGKSGGCSGYIVDYMPEECAFYGRPGYSRSYQSVDVIARKIPGQRAANGILTETYNYWYCYS
jgi:hypothetical protein